MTTDPHELEKLQRKGTVRRHSATQAPAAAPAVGGEATGFVECKCPSCGFGWQKSVAAKPASPLRGREALISVTASLAAAISILERTPKAKMAAPSNKMFEQMLDDYRRSLELGRAVLSSKCGRRT